VKSESNEVAADNSIEVFVQVEGRPQIAILRVSPIATVKDLVDEVVRMNLLDRAHSGQILCLLEDSEDELLFANQLDTLGVRHRSRIHLHRCRRVATTVHFNGEIREEQFPPSTTVAKVMRWAVGKKGFDLKPTDAVEHVLQITGSADRPDEDVHLGTLTTTPHCLVSFDLVPKRRVEG
jgi:hypothetical protein